MKPKLNCSLILFAASLLILGCKKDATNKNAEPYIASPQKVINMTGSDWATNKSQLSDKKNYWYTEFDPNLYPSVKAAVSLNAIDETYPQVQYYMLLNVQRGTEKVTTVSIETLDSLHHISKDEAYNLMLYYYNEGLQTITDTSFTLGNYAQPDGHEVTTTSKDVLNKLESGYESSLLSITYNSMHGEFSITLWKTSDDAPYDFSFAGFTN
jgi:hypothetical protein